VDVYRSWIRDFISPLRTVTPSVFLDPAGLAQYLVQQGMDPAEAAAIAAAAAQIPVGTVTPREAANPTDPIVAVQNFGSVSLWGMDVAFLAQVSPGWSVSASGSWTSRDQFMVEGAAEPVTLNAPARKGTVTLAYRPSDRGFSGALEIRAVEGFPILSGDYKGTLPGYALLGCRLAYPVTGPGRSTLDLTIENLLDRRHREFLGAPELGRMALLQWRVEIR
jgi:iron complex outermembrane receptor protein